jgi:hypothetical protein
MAGKDKLPAKIEEAIKQLGVQVEQVGAPATSEQIDNLGKYRDMQERTKHHRTIIDVWKKQQDQDRETRKRYANWLMITMSVQAVVINLIFVLIGCGVLKVEQWTANVFIGSVFAEMSSLVLLVVKYLFPATNDRILDLIDRFKDKGHAN